MDTGGVECFMGGMGRYPEISGIKFSYKNLFVKIYSPSEGKMFRCIAADNRVVFFPVCDASDLGIAVGFVPVAFDTFLGGFYLLQEHIKGVVVCNMYCRRQRFVFANVPPFAKKGFLKGRDSALNANQGDY